MAHGVTNDTSVVVIVIVSICVPSRRMESPELVGKKAAMIVFIEVAASKEEGGLLSDTAFGIGTTRVEPPVSVGEAVDAAPKGEARAELAGVAMVVPALGGTRMLPDDAPDDARPVGLAVAGSLVVRSLMMLMDFERFPSSTFAHWYIAKGTL